MATAGQCFPDGVVKRGIVPARVHEARRLANDFSRVVAREFDKGRVDRNDAVLRIRDQHGFSAVAVHQGGQLHVLLRFDLPPVGSQKNGCAHDDDERQQQQGHPVAAQVRLKLFGGLPRG